MRVLPRNVEDSWDDPTPCNHSNPAYTVDSETALVERSSSADPPSRPVLDVRVGPIQGGPDGGRVRAPLEGVAGVERPQQLAPGPIHGLWIPMISGQVPSGALGFGTGDPPPLGRLASPPSP